mmetsp:Transcript_61177/g.72635  ORF Transcript_61177/g.72635 Transcript_61177/m.72635 type:complete len:80 (+) Transcript_61177:1263-1502(+)
MSIIAFALSFFEQANKDISSSTLEKEEQPPESNLWFVIYVTVLSYTFLRSIIGFLGCVYHKQGSDHNTAVGKTKRVLCH